MDLGVAGRGYLIFGGTAGIGRAAAEVLAADGARVAVVGRRRSRAEAAAAEMTERARTAGAGDGGGDGAVVALVGDLTEPGEADRLVAEAADALGGLRGMAVTTGLGMHGQRTLAEATDADWRATFDDVLLATVSACRAALPVLVEGGGGSVVTTAAYSIRAPKPHQVPYGALKAGVATMSKAMAKTHGPDGVRVNCVCPGATETEVLAAMRSHYATERGWPVEEALERVMAEEWGMNVALGRAGRPDEVGDLIAFLLSERAGYLTGATINIDGGTDF